MPKIHLVLLTLLSSAGALAQPHPATPFIHADSSPSWLGVGIVEVNQQTAQRVGLERPAGVEVAQVAEGSPAERGGIGRGDVITRFRDEAVQGVEHFARLVRETPSGRDVELELRSAEGPRNLTIEVGERRPAPFAFARPAVAAFGPLEFDFPRPVIAVENRWLGATLESLEGQLAEYFGVDQGVLVRSVDDSSAAARADLKAGDVIVAVEGEPAAKPADIRRGASGGGDRTVALEVVRNRERRTLEVEAKDERLEFFRKPFRSRPVSSH